MNANDIRNHVAKSCGFTPNKAKHRQDLLVKLSPERLAHLESICQHHPENKAKQGEIPDSFEAWLKSNQDSIPLDRTEATCKWFDELPEQLPF